MRWILWIWLPAILLVARGAEATMETEEVRSLLEEMQAEEDVGRSRVYRWPGALVARAGA